MSCWYVHFTMTLQLIMITNIYNLSHKTWYKINKINEVYKGRNSTKSMKRINGEIQQDQMKCINGEIQQNQWSI